MAADRTFNVPVPFSPHYFDAVKDGAGTWWVAVLTQRDGTYRGCKLYQYDVNGLNPVEKLAPGMASWGAPKLKLLSDGGCVLESSPFNDDGVGHQVCVWRLDGPTGYGFTKCSWWNSTTAALVKQLQQLVAALGGAA
jgi:hypothetical protein